MIKKTTIVAQNKSHLKQLILDETEQNGHQCDLNHIDTSNITDMSELFSGLEFNGDISNWNTSNVIDMSCMFYKSKFNQDISQWDTSNVKNISDMFNNSEFNGDISIWNFSNVTDMGGMFYQSKFNGDIRQWNTSNVVDMSQIFFSSSFNGDLSNWPIINILKIINMTGMFDNCPATKPWWFIEDNDKRKEAIDKYGLMNRLNTELAKNEQNKIAKIKI